jgi:hypothetical protein
VAVGDGVKVAVNVEVGITVGVEVSEGIGVGVAVGKINERNPHPAINITSEINTPAAKPPVKNVNLVWLDMICPCHPDKQIIYPVADKILSLCS